jgi:catechol 2,3-dioxygenase-like lactoylglutathione lyase family enzyme
VPNASDGPPATVSAAHRGNDDDPRMPDDRPISVHETVLYTDDLDVTAAFYTDIVGLRLVSRRGRRLCALRIGEGPGAGVLLLFDPSEAEIPGRGVPSHGARGEGHIAFSVSQTALDVILERCGTAGVEVEQTVAWPRGGRSFYVRDPGRNSVEFIVGEIWPD